KCLKLRLLFTSGSEEVPPSGHRSRRGSCRALLGESYQGEGFNETRDLQPAGPGIVDLRVGASRDDRAGRRPGQAGRPEPGPEEGQAGATAEAATGATATAAAAATAARPEAAAGATGAAAAARAAGAAAGAEAAGAAAAEPGRPPAARAGPGRPAAAARPA